MRKKTNFIFWIFLILSVFLLINTISSSSERIRESTSFFFLPLQKIITNASINLTKNMEVFKKSSVIAEEIEDLRRENNKLYVQISDLNDLRRENIALKNALNIDLFEEQDFIFSRVTGRDLLNQFLTIHHTQPAKRGNFVVNSEGSLVGVITETENNFSRVRMLTHKDTSIEVKVQNEDEPLGIIRGGGGVILKLEFLPKDKEVEKGDIVITTSSTAKHSRGVFVGRISEVKRSDIDAFNSANVWQGIDYRYLDNLFILK